MMTGKFFTEQDLPTMESGSRMLEYCYQHREDMIELLKQFVQVESPSTVPGSQQKMLDLLQKELEARDFRVRRIRGDRTGGHLLAMPRKLPQVIPRMIPRSLNAAPQSSWQLLLGHCDTVWPLDTLDSMPLLQRHGKLFGPGTYDMKAGLVMALYAIDAVRACDRPLLVAPLVFINSDEEIGSHESGRHIHRLAKVVNRAYVLEPSLGPTGKVKTARKGVGRFTIKVQGRAAHAGLDPGKGASAILELAHVIQRLFALNDSERGITVNVGTVDGGIRSNVVAPESQAEVDVRVLRAEDARRIEAEILSFQSSTPGTQLKVSGRIGRPPMEQTPQNLALWQLAKTVAAENLGVNLETATAGGGSDGNTTSLYTPTLDGLGAVGDGAHAPGEFVYLDQLIERTALLSELLLLPPV